MRNVLVLLAVFFVGSLYGQVNLNKVMERSKKKLSNRLKNVLSAALIKGSIKHSIRLKMVLIIPLKVRILTIKILLKVKKRRLLLLNPVRKQLIILQPLVP